MSRIFRLRRRIFLVKRAPTLLAVFLLSISAVAAKRMDDVLIMKNGDRLTGEIKKMEKGDLYFETEYTSDPIKLDWDKVVRLETRATFIIGFSSGAYLGGVITIESPREGADANASIAGKAGVVRVRQAEIASVYPLKPSFWSQIKGSVNLGFSFTASNRQTNYSLGGNVSFRDETKSLNTSFSSSVQAQENISSSERHNLQTTFIRNLPGRWFVGGLADFLRNTQQSLNLRSTFGGLAGYNQIQTARTVFAFGGGAVYTHENYVPESGREPVSNNIEALGVVQFSTYRFDKSYLVATCAVYPSFSNVGRVRLDFDTRFQYFLTGDFFWQFEVYDNFDSRPPIDSSKNDFGVTMSVGYSF